MSKKKPFIITDDYSGMGSFIEALKYLKIPPEELALFRTEFDPVKNDIFNSVHGNWIDQLSDYKHVLDATGADASAEGVKDWIKTTYTDVDDDGRPDLMSITSPCHGASGLNTSKNSQMLDNKDSATLIPVMERVRELNPVEYFHEMVNTNGKKKYAGSETFDLLLHDRTGKLINATDFNNPEHIRYMWKKLNELGYYKPKMSLRGEDFSPQTNAHEFRATFPLSINNLFNMKPFLRSKKGKRLFNPEVFLNVEREPGESFVDYAKRVHNIDPESLGPDRILTHKDTLNRFTHSGNNGLSPLYYSLTNNSANMPLAFEDDPSITPEELEELPYDYLNGPDGKRSFKRLDSLLYQPDPTGIYRKDAPPGVVHTTKAFSRPSLRLTGSGGSLENGHIYRARPLTPEQGARLLGWDPAIVSAARKAGLQDHEINAAYGDAYPLQHAIMVLLQSPALWARFPEQMRAARDDFLSHGWSDLRLKDIKPSDAMIKNIKRVPWIDHRFN